MSGKGALEDPPPPLRAGLRGLSVAHARPSTGAAQKAPRNPLLCFRLRLPVHPIPGTGTPSLGQVSGFGGQRLARAEAPVSRPAPFPPGGAARPSAPCRAPWCLGWASVRPAGRL